MEEKKVKNQFPKNPLIEYYKKNVDMSLLKENLKLTPTERVKNLMALQKMAEELKKAGKTLRGEE
ncbi:MAG: hypothetical protein AAGC85_02225 [Bacteroidota bacterium]